MSVFSADLACKKIKIHINGDCVSRNNCVPLQRISENALRVKAAAQHSSNKFDSAFALHFPCTFYKHKLMN